MTKKGEAVRFGQDRGCSAVLCSFAPLHACMHAPGRGQTSTREIAAARACARALLFPSSLHFRRSSSSTFIFPQ